jgi:hypothetical protein
MVSGSGSGGSGSRRHRGLPAADGETWHADAGTASNCQETKIIVRGYYDAVAIGLNNVIIAETAGLVLLVIEVLSR